MNKYYVKAITARGMVIGYGVYDTTNSTETEHIRFSATDKHVKSDVLVALHNANEYRDDLNNKIK